MLDEIAKWLLSVAILGLIIVPSMFIWYLLVNWPQYVIIGVVVISIIAAIRFLFFD